MYRIDLLKLLNSQRKYSLIDLGYTLHKRQPVPKAQIYSYRTRDYKTFFLLNSPEHEILNHKHENIKKFSIFRLDKPRMLFFLLINVKMPTTVEQGKIELS